jgi:hypothetical protein
MLAIFAFPASAADLLLFPSISSEHRSRNDNELGEDKFVPGVDIFYSTDYNQTRFLAEYMASSREQDLERFQVGRRILPGKTLWVGRFHNSLSFWNTLMHHGEFMQTSLSRPTLANFEDEHGPLPTHITGFLLDSSRISGDSEVNYMAGMGIGPTFDTTLQPLDLLDPSRPGKIAASFRMGYHPEVGNPNQFGAAYGYARIPVIASINPAIYEVRQNIFSTFLNIEHERFHLIGELFIFNNLVSATTGTTRRNTLSAYLQPEYKLGESGKTTLYGRIESTPNAELDNYLEMLPEFSRHQVVAGFRFDITPSQAVKFEGRRSYRMDRVDSNPINTISAQWCMVLPL